MQHTPSRQFLKRNTTDPMKGEYLRVCARKGLMANPRVRSSLGKNEVCLDLDTLGSQAQQDWQGV